MSGLSACTTATSLACWRCVLRRRLRAALGREAAAAAVAVEQVVQVEAGDAQLAGHARRRRPRRLAHLQHLGELQPVLAATLVEYAGGARECAAGTQRRGCIQPLCEEPERARVLAQARVVEQQAATGIVGGDGLRLRSRRRHFNRLQQARAEGGDDLAIAGEAVVAGHHQRRGDAQAHALVGFPVGGRCRQLDRRRQFARGEHRHHGFAQRGQRGALVADFSDAAGDLDAIAGAQPGFGLGFALHEQAFGAARIAIVAFGLHEHALHSGGEVADDDAPHGDLAIDQCAARAAALHGADRADLGNRDIEASRAGAVVALGQAGRRCLAGTEKDGERRRNGAHDGQEARMPRRAGRP